MGMKSFREIVLKQRPESPRDILEMKDYVYGKRE